MEFGAFVNFFGAKDGRCTSASWRGRRSARSPTVSNEGDTVKVKLLGFDDRGKTKLSMTPSTRRPAPTSPPKSKPNAPLAASRREEREDRGPRGDRRRPRRASRHGGGRDRDRGDRGGDRGGDRAEARRVGRIEEKSGIAAGASGSSSVQVIGRAGDGPAHRFNDHEKANEAHQGIRVRDRRDTAAEAKKPAGKFQPQAGGGRRQHRRDQGRPRAERERVRQERAAAKGGGSARPARGGGGEGRRRRRRRSRRASTPSARTGRNRKRC